MSKLKLASIVFLLSTILLKFSSMIRDLVIASFFGNSYMADVYFAAMTILNHCFIYADGDEGCIFTKLFQI